MGIRLVGDRLMFKKALRELQKHARMVKRSAAIWEGRENLYYCCAERLCVTCCGCCPDDAATYVRCSATPVSAHCPDLGPARRWCCFEANALACKHQPPLPPRVSSTGASILP